MVHALTKASCVISLMIAVMEVMKDRLYAKVILGVILKLQSTNVIGLKQLMMTLTGLGAMEEHQLLTVAQREIILTEHLKVSNTAFVITLRRGLIFDDYIDFGHQ